MAQDPEQQPNIDDAPDPQYPYGATPQAPQEVPGPRPSYLSPEFYEQQATPVQQLEAQSGYTVPTPGPYIPPPLPSYNPQAGYAPPQRSYGAGSNYGHGGSAPEYEYKYGVPESLLPLQATPLPLGEAIRQLPRQYWQAITRPSSVTFASETGKAGWGIVWVQIVFYTVFMTALGFLSNLLVQPRSLAATDTSSLTPATIAMLQKFLGFLTLSSTYGQVLLIPLSLFLGTGVLFLLAKAFGGVGKFLPQLYSTLLFIVPLGIIVNVVVLLLNFLPTVGSLLTILIVFANLGYEGTLLSFMLMPVHRLSGGRAAGAVLILFGVGLLLACVLGFIIAIILTAMAQPQ